MNVSTSYPVLPTDTEETLNSKEQQALVELFNQLILSGIIKRSEGTDFFNGGFVKKVNLSLYLPEETGTITVSATPVDEEVNEPLTSGCTSCSN